MNTRVLPLLIAIALPLLAHSALAQKSAPAKPDASAKDQGWPRSLERDGVRVVYYQPQIDDWKDQRVLSARMAFLITPRGGKATPGIVTLSGNTKVDLASRTVFIDKLQIGALTFPGSSAEQTATLTALMKKEFPGKALTMSLDRVMAAVAQLQKENKGVPVQMPVPVIFASASPAVLLLIPDKPVLGPVAGSSIQFVLNANWNLFFDAQSTTYYLLAGTTWLSGPALTGPWSLAVVPPSILNLPPGDMWNAVRKSANSWITGPNTVVPRVFYSAKPAELMLFNGEPTYETIPGTTLEWATNTDSHVFWDYANKQFYFMVTGRWFRSASLEGPWAYAGNDLPASFKAIPASNPSASVLSSVPGTQDAADAVLLAQVPTTAIVNRAQAEAKAKVAYYGDPIFKTIDGTSLSYATNTNADVIQDGSKFYLCQNAVWFEGGSPNGPWKVTTTIPAAIYNIPPSAPVYNVTYVQQTETSNPATIESSYTAGYTGSYVAGFALGAALVYGTGYDYPPYVGWAGGFPVYQPWYGTYGYGAAYNWGVGAFGVGGYGYGPYGAAGRAAWYNPSTGFYNRAATAVGPYGGRTIAEGYNPRTGTAYATKQGYGPYASWGTTAATRGDQWVQAGHVTTPYGSAAGYRGSDGAGAARTNASGGKTGVAVHGDNMYAGRDGNVYERSAGGGWSKVGVGGSEPAYHGGQTAAATGYRPPEDTSRALSNDYATRSAGYNQAASFASNDGGWTDRTQGFTDSAARYGDSGERAAAYGDHFGGGSFDGAHAGGGGAHRGGGGAYRGGGGGRR